MPVVTSLYGKFYFFPPFRAGAERMRTLGASCRLLDVFECQFSQKMQGNRRQSVSLVAASPSASAWCLLALARCHLEDWQIV